MRCEFCGGDLVPRGHVDRRTRRLRCPACDATYTKRVGEALRRLPFGPLVGRWAAGSTRRSEIEHAVTDEGTLCGLPGEKVEIYRHPFWVDREKSCPTCRELALEHVRRWPPERN